VARLVPGATLSQARSELNQVARDLEQIYPETNRGIGLTASPLRDTMVGDVRRPLLLLLGAVGCLLMIACMNVANLLLARGLSRGRELSVRAALGASRSRIVQQLLVENVLMSTIAGVAGIFLSNWGVRALVGIGFDALPRIYEARVDGRMLAFTLLAAIGTGLLFGLVPALHGTGSRLAGRLSASRGSSDAEGHRLRDALVIAEIALALVLAIGSGLLIRSFWRMMGVNPGFNPDRLTTFSVALPGTRYPRADQRQAFFDRLLASVSSLPSVEAAGSVNRLPFSGTNTPVGIEIEGQAAPVRPDANVVDRRVANRDYFRTAGIPLVAGRSFDEYDSASALLRVAIINETLAHKAWPGQSPISRRVRLSLLSGPGPWLSVVGVVGDVKHHGLDVPAYPELYVPYPQAPVESMFIVIRGGTDARALAPSVRSLVRTIDSSLPVNDVVAVRSLIADSVAQPRLRMLLFGGFAVAALMLAMIGVYGVVSYSVSSRTRDIGVRMALGAHPHDIRAMVLGEGFLLAVMGVGTGVLASFALTRLLASMMFEISPADPITFIVVSLLLTGIALLAAFVPAHRAARVDPIQALRIE
jgi:putative ABC transport system permease protein